ncbi:MAG: aconitate hydratase AcnA [Planctomycetes bacterium]|nr:aconitate hydratase AcnA [Planctomycetota bacterium]
MGETKKLDPFEAGTMLQTALGERKIHSLAALRKIPGAQIDTLPYTIKVLLEACLRNLDGFAVTEDAVRTLALYDPKKPEQAEIPFLPGRVVLQDFTGVPAVVDLAAMRSAMQRLGGDPARVRPLVPCDLVIDHSVQVDVYGTSGALAANSEKEFQRNGERYEFLKWGQQAFENLRVVPPATGIVHQVNLEYLAKVVWEKDGVLFPDSLVGTDSHTTMINGLGVVGWGVGGIEAEAVMLGQPIYMLVPEVIGFRLKGRLPEGATATDLVLRVTQMLRAQGVVDKIVEFFGPGLDQMPVANRATIANMAPEYGATMGYFPVDEQTLQYLRFTGREAPLVEAVEQYCRAQGLWRDEARAARYTAQMELDLGSVVPSLAGPRRPQDRVNLADVRSQWQRELTGSYKRPAGGAAVQVQKNGDAFELRDGSVVIAAITSCTNTSNPSVMIGAGLLARKARDRGLTSRPWVKTSFAPGSKVVTEYLEHAGLMEDLEALGFFLVGYGCTTCIGNSGPLPDAIRDAIAANNLVAVAVLSGNRNFEGRIGPDVKANYLASPPLVVAYAIAGTIDIDLTKEPLGVDAKGKRIFLRDIWPSQKEVDDLVGKAVKRDHFAEQYADVFTGSKEWQEIRVVRGPLYRWAEQSTYIQEPPFFTNLSREPAPIRAIGGARCLALVGDSVTTDHISPAGSIKKESPAGQYLISRGVDPANFNSYGSRRGNDRVMTRGTFANIRLKNLLVPGSEGGVTRDFLSGETASIYDAAMRYQEREIPLVVIAGKDYGMGSSRDWAAKGTFLLGVRAVIAQSFERIHRSNLVGMGVLPLCFRSGESAASLGLKGDETFDIEIGDSLQPRQEVQVTACRPDGSTVAFTTQCRADTPIEVEYYRNGGILHTVLRRMAKS